MTGTPVPPPDDELVVCEYENNGRKCGRRLTNPASRTLHLSLAHFEELVSAARHRRRRVIAVHKGQLVLDLETDVAVTGLETDVAVTRHEGIPHAKRHG